MDNDRISALEAKIDALTRALETKSPPPEKRYSGKTAEGVVRDEERKLLIVPDRLVRGNRAAYLEMQAIAELGGLEMKIASDAPVKPIREMPPSFESDRAIYVARPVLNGDAVEYKFWKAKAEAAGKRLIVANTASEMPVEAFGETK